MNRRLPASSPARFPLALFLFVAAGCGSSDSQPGASTPAAYEVGSGTESDPQLYVPVVDQLNIAAFSVSADHGSTLTVGHPVKMSGEVDLTAEPFKATLWYGLASADGSRRCVIDHVELDHLEAMYDAAERANAALSQQAAEARGLPSLTDCSDGKACPSGEECLAFVEAAQVSGPMPEGASDPNAPLLDKGEPGEAPGEEVGTVTTHRCSTRTWAAAEVAATHGAAPRLTPASLAGSQRQTHVFGATDELPASCGALVGEMNVVAWIAFDPEGRTRFAARPALPDGGLVGSEDGGLTAAHLAGADELKAFAERLPQTATIAAVRADPGLDVDFRSLEVGSSVVNLLPDDHKGGDFTVNADYSLDGTPTPQQQAALAGASVTFHFTLRPIGAPQAGCELPPNVALDAAPLQIVHLQGGNAQDVDEEPGDATHLGTERQHSYPLYLPAPLRARVFGDWSCWDQFEVKGCLTTNLPESQLEGGDDDCAATTIVALRDVPPDGATLVKEPPGIPAPPPLHIGAKACDDALFQKYADLMKKYYELENTVFITDYYTYDWASWMWGSIQKDSGVMKYVTDYNRRVGYFNHAKSFIDECETRGRSECWKAWAWNNSPWSIDLTHYRNQFIPYFWNPYNLETGAYAGFKRDAQAFTRDGFNFEVGSSRVDLQACKLEYSIVSPK